MNPSREADAFLHSGDPAHLDWKPTGRTRTRRFLWWTWTECEERRLIYRPAAGLEPSDSWSHRTRWVRA